MTFHEAIELNCSTVANPGLTYDNQQSAHKSGKGGSRGGGSNGALLFFNVASQCWYVQSFDPGLLLLIIYF